jgi:Flp pilus assembly protein TadG
MDTRSIFRRIFNPALRFARIQSSTPDEEGSAIMETAMSIIILLTFMFGVMEGSLAIYSYHFISEAAREGTRYAIVRGSTAGAACGTSYNSYDCMASSGNIQSYVQNLGYPGIIPSNLTVSSVWAAYASGNSCPASPPCNSPGNQVTVKVTYSFPLNVPFIPPHTYSMSSSAAMIIQQ